MGYTHLHHGYWSAKHLTQALVPRKEHSLVKIHVSNLKIHLHLCNCWSGINLTTPVGIGCLNHRRVWVLDITSLLGNERSSLSISMFLSRNSVQGEGCSSTRWLMHHEMFCKNCLLCINLYRCLCISSAWLIYCHMGSQQRVVIKQT